MAENDKERCLALLLFKQTQHPKKYDRTDGGDQQFSDPTGCTEFKQFKQTVPDISTKQTDENITEQSITTASQYSSGEQTRQKSSDKKHKKLLLVLF